MAYAMTKRGSLDNCVTYEFICDTVADMNAIEDRYRTIGSTAVVLQGDAGLEVYISGSDKIWTSLSVINSSGSVPSGGGLSFHICGQDELDANGLPDVSEPDEVTFYLVPAADETTGNIYDEYIYVDDEWERFGGGGAPNIDLSAYAPKANPEFTGSISLGRTANSTVGENSVATGNGTIASALNSHAEGTNTVASGQSSHAEGAGNGQTAITYNTYANFSDGQRYGSRTTSTTAQAIPGANGAWSHVEGYNTLVASSCGHAEGYNNAIFSSNSYATHVEGYENAVVSGQGGHAEGYHTYAAGANGVHVEGYHSMAGGAGGEHAEGMYTHATGGGGGHAEGYLTFSAGANGCHAEGYHTTAFGNASHAEGSNTYATGYGAHAEGYGSTNEWTPGDGIKMTRSGVASGYGAHVEGYNTLANGDGTHAEGSNNIAKANSAHSEGCYTVASGNYTHAEGYYTIANAIAAHAEGMGGQVTLNNGQILVSGANYTAAHSEGYFTRADYGFGAHSEGYLTYAYGKGAHAEGDNTYAHITAHAEGDNTQANGSSSHAEGHYTIAAGGNSHVSGQYNIEDNYSNWSEWTANTSYAVGDKIKVTTTNNNETTIKAYICKTANSDAEFTSSKWKTTNLMNYAEIIGNGETNARSNARVLDWDGNERLMGDLYVGCNADSTGGSKVATEAYVTTTLANASSVDTSALAPKASPVFTGSISLGRKASSNVGTNSLAIGDNNTASGKCSVALGKDGTASGSHSVSLNYYTQATGDYSTALGHSTKARGSYAIAGGYSSEANSASTLAFGDSVIADYAGSYVFGKYNIADNINNIAFWAANTAYQVGDVVKYQNGQYLQKYICKTAHTSNNSFSSTYWINRYGEGNYIEIIGNGTAYNARSNARALDWDGNEYLNGDIYVGCDASSANGVKLARIPDAPSTDGTYTLQCVVSSGVPTYSWISTGA